MNKEENNNHILIEVLNNDGDLKLTKFRNPQAIWQNNDYPDEYVFRDVDIVNVFKLIQENKQLKERVDKAISTLEKFFPIRTEHNKNEFDLAYKIIQMLKEIKGDSNEN